MSRTLVSWSSGKDSAWMLGVLARDPDIEIAGLVTTFSEAAGRVAMHDVRRELVAAQARAAGLPLWEVMLPAPCPNAVYEERMAELVGHARLAGIEQMAFGDLYLEDIRAYREQRLAGSGISALFPIWCGADGTAALAREMIDAGLRAIVSTVDGSRLDAGCAGQVYDQAFIDALPAGVDACGENGEFHTFCHVAPAFAQPIAVRAGAVAERDGFVYCDVMPAGDDR